MSVLVDAAKELEAQLSSIPGVKTQVVIHNNLLRVHTWWIIGNTPYEFEYEISRAELEFGRFGFIERAAKRIRDERSKRFPAA